MACFGVFQDAQFGYYLLDTQHKLKEIAKEGSLGRHEGFVILSVLTGFQKQS